MTDLPPIPLVVRTRLAHATLQAVADDCGADILHIKGAAVDASLRPAREDSLDGASAKERALPRVSADADVLVRPEHLVRLLAALSQYGWRGTRFYSRGAVEHSVDWWHPELGNADLHIRFPGIQLAPDEAFAELWRGRRDQDIAHRPCPVPGVVAQRLLLLLHAARNGQPESADVRRSWTSATTLEQDRVRELAATLRAEVALAGATGHLDDYSHRPEYDLWRLYGLPEADVFDLWVAMVKAAPTTKGRAWAILYAFRVKTDRLSMGLQRRATPMEVLSGHSHRLVRGGAGLLGLICRLCAQLAGRLRGRAFGASS